MKRNLLLLAVMTTMVFGFYSLGPAQCPEDPNDLGECDTLIVEAFCGDTALFEPVEQKMRIPIWVVHDDAEQPDGIDDSISAFVVPLCFTSSNAAANAHLPDTSNKTYVYPFPFLWQSVFRHLDCGTDHYTNWMMALSEKMLLEEWDTRIVNLAGEGPTTDVFWMALFPTGSEDRRFEGTAGERVLLATITLHIEDSTMFCLDSCFWPPNSRLTFTRLDAASYIPRHNLPWCHDYFRVPNRPPYFAEPELGVDDQEHSQNGHYPTDDFRVADDDGTIASVVASPTSLPGVANIAVVMDKQDEQTGHVEYDVVDHCLAGGTVTVTATDNQGAFVTDDFTITLTNDPPTINAGGDKTGAYNVQLCSDDMVTGDPNGDAVTWDILSVAPAPFGPFSKVGDAVCFDAICDDVGVTYTVTVEATDACGATATDDVTFLVSNAPPTVTCPSNFTETSGKTIVLTEGVDYFMDDPEGEALIKGFSITPGYAGSAGFDNGTFTWVTTADDEGIFEVCFDVEDECGLTDQCCFDVELVSYGFSDIGFLPPCPQRGCCLPCFNPGDYVKFPIWLNNETTPFGGFELAIEFDYTSMCFVDAELAYAGTDAYGCEGIVPQDFEHFTYRLLPCPTPPCQKFKILLYGQYDLPNGTLGSPIPMEEGAIVYLNFVINNNENLRGFMIPVCFEWEGTVEWDEVLEEYVVVEDWNCQENTFSGLSGDTLYVDQLLCRFNGEACEDPPSDRIQPVLTFVSHVCGQDCGGILVCEATAETCKRGDVNYNELPYEVADAVLFASYFVNGEGVFRYDPVYQICATDANADGRPLTLSDLVYLIRVAVNDAYPIPKLAPSTEVANVIVYNGTITTECSAPIAAMLFEFDGAVAPVLLADMEMVNNGNRVLVWSRDGNSFTTAEVLSFTGAELVSVTAVDYDTRELKTTITAKAAPTAFALNPAYPNPFNPYVNLSFLLPEAMNYSLKIYNVAGQLVRSYEGVGSPSLNVVTWDGKDNAGVEVSSGVYFYKLIAGGFTATEKMVMMK